MVSILALFTLTLSKKIDNGSENDCSVSVEADTFTDDVHENFKMAMSLFNMIDVLPYGND